MKTLLLLLFCPALLAGQTVIGLADESQPVLERSIAIMGHAPRFVVVQSSLAARGVTIGDSITITRSRDQDALTHELGHFWSFVEPLVSEELADSLHLSPYTVDGNERLAESFASLLRAQNDTAQTNNRNAKILYRILRRSYK